MKHLLNNMSESEKNSIREQHKGGMMVDTSRFKKLLESKLGNSKPLISEDETPAVGGSSPSTAATTNQQSTLTPQQCDKSHMDALNTARTNYAQRIKDYRVTSQAKKDEKTITFDKFFPSGGIVQGNFRYNYDCTLGGSAKPLQKQGQFDKKWYELTDSKIIQNATIKGADFPGLLQSMCSTLLPDNPIDQSGKLMYCCKNTGGFSSAPC